MPHTLHAVRTVDRRIQFCGECALTDRNQVQRLLRTWTEGVGAWGIVSLAPEPAWWHLAEAAETRTLRSDADVRHFAERLPHSLRAPLEVMACDAMDGKGVSPDGEERWLLGVTQGEALTSAAAEANQRGIVTAALGSAVLDSVGAAVTAVQLEGAGVVRLWAIGQRESFVFTIGVRGIQAIERSATGFESIFTAVQQVFGTQTLDEAKALFFATPPEPEAAAQLAAAIVPSLRDVFGAGTRDNVPVRFACTGLTGQVEWFGRAMAQAVGLPWWQPNLPAFLDHLQLRLPVGSEAAPSLGLLGTLHLAAIHPGQTAAWHPAWGFISRSAAPRGIRRPIKAAVAPPPPPLPAAVALAAAARARMSSGLPSFLLPANRTKAPGPPRAPASPANPPGLARAADSRTGAGAVAPADPAPVMPREGAVPSDSIKTVIPATSPVAPTARTAARGGSIRRPTRPASPELRSGANPVTPALQRKRAAPDAARAVPTVPSHVDAPENGASGAVPTRNRKPAPAWPPAEEDEEGPPSGPSVVVLRRSGYWPLVGIALALVGAGVGGKFYRDAQAVKAAAEAERLSAYQAQMAAEREVAAAVKHVRFTSEQAVQAELQARAAAEAKARELERVRGEMEAARLEALEQGRREAIEQARREAEEQTVRLLARELAAARAAGAPGSAQPAARVENVAASGNAAVAIAEPQRAPRGPARTQFESAGGDATPDIAGLQPTGFDRFALEPATGAVTVASTPPDLEFSIRASNTPADAAPLRRGRTPARLNDLPPGEYEIRFRREGWPDRTERVVVAGSAVARVAATFQAGTVVINSSPTGATVLQEGLVLGRTPLTLGAVPPQTVAYELRVPGYEPLKVSGTVAEGRALELNGTLQDLNRVAEVGEVRTPPRPYLNPPLSLGRVPRSAPSSITVTFVVLPNGSLEDIRIVETLDRKLAARVLAGMGKWRFHPGVSHAGYPVKVRMSMLVKLAGR